MNRHRIALDTNVLISAILFGGKPRRVLDLVISGSVDCTLSTAILDELKDVLQRPKFGFSADVCFHIIEELHGACDIISPSVSVDVIRSDPDDDRILECAVDAQAHFIVSGDPHLLDLGKFEKIRILSPADYLKEFA
ncbi:MAG: putative toxin-antitoxin system toxin component, PIN family [Candidatus Hodarchaeota archaeon]